MPLKEIASSEHAAMTPVLSDLFAALACLITLMAGYALLTRLLRAFVSFLDEVLDVAVALFFYVVIVPPLWVWEKGRRPMWRTLTKQQSQELQAWLKMTASR